jgi:hypothetical protein
MSFFLFALAGIAVACTARWSVQVRRRNTQTWESLLARLQPGWNSPDWAESAQNEPATPEERWNRVHGASGLCTMYQNARVMQEMADFAVRHNTGIDLTLLAELRSDALQIRFLVLTALGEYALHQVNEGISGKAGRAASIYQEMSARMSGLLEVGATPSMQFVGAR